MVHTVFVSAHTNLCPVTLTLFCSACEFCPPPPPALTPPTSHTCFRLKSESDCWFIPEWLRGNPGAAAPTRRSVVVDRGDPHMIWRRRSGKTSARVKQMSQHNLTFWHRVALTKRRPNQSQTCQCWKGRHCEFCCLVSCQSVEWKKKKKSTFTPSFLLYLPRPC